MISVAIDMEVDKRFQALLTDVELIAFFGSGIDHGVVEGVFLGKDAVK